MFILVDDEDRENEGDLVIPAQMATPDAINFMARHGRGLICLALTKERADQLGLEPMTRTNRSRNETAFTVSIEAKEGITTGISAADRARTIAVAIDVGQRARRDRLARPRLPAGRAGPAACSSAPAIPRPRSTSSRLAGLNPSGVICEIMREDGTMARLDDLMDFARAHGLKIGTIRDLIAYRLKKDHLVEQRRDRAVHREQRRASGRRRSSATRRAARSSSRWSTARSIRRAGAGADAQPRPVRRRARRSGPALGRAPGRDADDRGGRLGRGRRAPRRRAGLAVALDRPSRRQAGRGRRRGARLWHRRADPRRARHPRHDPADQHPPFAGRARRAMASRSSKSGRSRWRPERWRRSCSSRRASIRTSTTCCSTAPARAIEAAGHKHETLTVPGALELPGAIALAARSGRFCAFVALGVVIRGETYHFEVVSNESARGPHGPDAAGLRHRQRHPHRRERGAGHRPRRSGARDKGGGAAEAALALFELREKYAP